MKIIGLTGSIGMGKSTTANMLRARGMPVFDADAEVRKLQMPDGCATPPMREAFPECFRDGVLDREALRAKIFNDEAARLQLEGIIHPLVQARRQAFLQVQEKDGTEFVVLDIPLLFETGADKDCDVVLVASAHPDIQAQRVLERPGMTGQIFADISSRQLSDAEKRARADFVIDTSDGLDDAADQVDQFVEYLRQHKGAAQSEQ